MPQPQPHEVKWGDFYREDEHGRFALLWIDINLKKIAPEANFPHYFSVAIPFEVHQSNGLPTEKQYNDFWQLENIILENSKKISYYFIGSATYDGYRKLIFYVLNKSQANSFKKQILKSLPDWKKHLFFEDFEDMRWTEYLERLYPVPYEMEVIHSNYVVRDLQSQGDQIHIARPIIHTSIFSYVKMYQAADYEKWLVNNAFRIRKKEEKYNGDIQFEFSKNEAPSAMHNIIPYLWQKTKDMGGDYLGWATVMV
ncbi:MAG: DUF695 domain-containing protein [Capnocytophaga sp.]|nr:DUF695 domain-containing protein [Capnocytophaga sp.]